MLQPGDTLGAFRIEARIGQGGMGVVYRASQVGLGRDVALKVIAGEQDAQLRALFEREARLAAAAEHPNVLPVYEAGEANGRLYLATRLIDGVDLERLVRLGGPLEPARAAAVIAQTAAGLDAAHRRGLVHRDVKPRNILIADPGVEDHVYLSDFGLARLGRQASTLLEAGQTAGTVDYMAPEQIRGEPVDARTDVYALGGVLYFALTGEVPFAREATEAKLWAHLSDAPPRAPAFADVVARAMAKDPAERFASAGELAAALDGAEAPRPRRRRRVLAGVVAAVVAAAATAGVIATRGQDQPGAAATATLRLRVAATIGTGTSPGDIVLADRTVWVGGVAPARIHALSNERLEGAELPDHVQRVLHALGCVWLLSARRGFVLQRRDSESGEQLGKSLRLDPMTLKIDGIAAAGGSVWLLERTIEGSRLLRIDPSTFTASDRVPLRDAAISDAPADQFVLPDDLAAGDGSLWHVAVDGALVELDPATGNELARFDVGGPGTLAVGDGAVWVARRADGVLVKVTPATRTVETVEVGGNVLAVAAHGSRVWVTRGQAIEPPGSGPTPASLIALDARTHRRVAGPVPLGRSPLSLTVDERNVWVANQQDATAMRITY